MNDILAIDGDLAIRRMRDEAADYERIVDWRRRDHVREWWDPDDEPPGLAAVVAEMRTSTLGTDATTSTIIELAGRAVGFLQFYPWSDDEDYLAEVGLTLPDGAWGLDLFIGEEALLGLGVGSRTVAAICRYLFTERSAAAVALATEATNLHAQAAYRRAGMREVRRFLDTDLRNGQRVESVLMIIDRPGGTAAGR